jgi:pilus assembly protein CpaF
VADDRFKMFKQSLDQYLGPVKPYLDDPNVSEILINGPSDVFIESGGKLQRVPVSFRDDDAIKAAVMNIAGFVERRVDMENPRLDARLPDGSRIAAVIYPIARRGTCISIRKFTQSKITFKDYVKLGALSPDAAAFMDCCMILGKNVIVSGGTGSGKTTLLGMLCSRIPPGQRILVIEDSSELSINYDHIVNFETRMADTEGKGEVSMKDLLKSALRLRPDRIIVGEVRSSEAMELINAMNTGHKGCLGTVHANSPEDAIFRLESLAQGGDAKISERALRHQVASAIDIIIQVSRYSDGSRRVGSIAEVLGFDENGGYEVRPVFEIPRMIKGPDGKLHGELQATGYIPSFMNEIIDNNLPFPASKFKKPTAA